MCGVTSTQVTQRQQKETSALYLRYERRGLFYVPLRESLFGLHALVREFLSVITDDRKFEVLPLEAVDQQDDVAN
jgi:hypothetical protein